MPDSSFSPQRLFISYSRADGRDFAELFEKMIAEHDLKSWRDLKDVEGGEDIRPQVLRAIEKAEHLVLILTQHALASDWVKREWTHARQNGVKVSPILADPAIKRSDLPSWARRADIYDIAEPERWNKLIQVLKGPGKMRRVPYMAGLTSPNYVQRCEPYARLKELVMAEQQDKTVALTTALQGAGGYGKTTLANALCRDEDVQFEFSDGIIRVEVGKERLSVLPLILDVLAMLDPENKRVEFTDEKIAGEHLGEVLGEARLLLVIDDVWREVQLAPFLLGGKNCVRFVTTRIPCVLPPGSASVPVDEMQPEESLDLLAWKLPIDDPDLRVRLAALARRLEHWAQLLEMANGWLRGRIGRGEPLGQAIDKFDQRLTNKGLTAFDPKISEQRNRAVAACIEASLEDLESVERVRFETLAILPEDEALPLTIVEALWKQAEGLDQYETEDFLDRLASLSLLQGFDLGSRTVRLHDNILWYLRDKMSEERLTQAHGAMAEALVRQCDGNWTDLSAENVYGWRFGLRHLRLAGRLEEVDALLTDYTWIKRKLTVRGAQELLEAYLLDATGPEAQLVGRAVALSVPTLSKQPDQLGHQIWGRLKGRSDTPRFLTLVAMARNDPEFRLKPRWPGLKPPGAELLRLVGHEGNVNSASFSADGLRIVTASDDKTARVWNAMTGAELFVLRGHEGRVIRAAFSTDGRSVITISGYGTARVWDAATRAELAVLRGHHADVISASFAVDGRRIVIAFLDGTVHVWGVPTGKELFARCMDECRVSSVSISDDGCRIAIALVDGTTHVWDVATAKVLAVFRGHESLVESVSFIADGGRIVTGSFDNTARVWDANTRKELAVLRGHENWVACATFAADGRRVVTASSDMTVRVWDASSGAELAIMRGHDNMVESAVFAADGQRIVTASRDGTARVWDVSTGPEVIASCGCGHENWVSSVSISSDGCLVATASGDGTARVWDAAKGFELAVLRGHNNTLVSSATFSDDVRWLVTGSWDKTARVWDIGTRKELAILHGHENPVNSAAFVADSSLIVTASTDWTARVWDAATWSELFVLSGHEREVLSAVFAIDGRRIVTASGDRTARVWDATTGKELLVLLGHESEVCSAAFVADDCFIVTVSKDRTARVWDAATGVVVAVLPGYNDLVKCVALTSNGWYVVTSSNDNMVRVFDVTTSAELGCIVFDATIRSFDLSKNTIVLGDNLGKVHVLDFDFVQRALSDG